MHLEHIENIPPQSGWRRCVSVSSAISTGILLVAMFLIVALSTHLQDTQWDFTTYYYAGKVSASGGDVYNLDVSRALAGGYVHQYLYPPIVARLFRPLASLTFETSRQIWFWLHVLALVPLIWMWRRFFIIEGPAWAFYLLAVTAFSESIYLDLKAGNMTIIEQLLLWTGFVCLIRSRITLFCAFIVAASLFKGLPVLFLGLLFLLPAKRKWLYLAGSLLAFALVQLVDYVWDPGAFRGFLIKALSWDERGPEFNPSVLALLRDMKAVAVKSGLSEQAGSIWVNALYGAIVLTVAVVSWRLIRRAVAVYTRRCSAEFATSTAVLASTLAFAIMVPRFKMYSFMLVLPAVYFVIRRFGSRLLLPLTVVMAALTTHPHLPLEQSSVDLFWWYYPMLVLILFWVVWVAGTAKDDKTILVSEHFPTAN